MAQLYNHALARLLKMVRAGEVDPWTAEVVNSASELERVVLRAPEEEVDLTEHPEVARALDRAIAALDGLLDPAEGEGGGGG